MIGGYPYFRKTPCGGHGGDMASVTTWNYELRCSGLCSCSALSEFESKHVIRYHRVWIPSTARLRDRHETSARVGSTFWIWPPWPGSSTFEPSHTLCEEMAFGPTLGLCFTTMPRSLGCRCRHPSHLSRLQRSGAQ